MSMNSGGRPGARKYRVWDPLVRITHWGVALGVLLNAALTDPEGTLHEQVGYVVLGLVVLRLLWCIVGPRMARFAAFPPSPAAALAHVRDMLGGDRAVHLSHNPLGALMAYNLWLTLLVLSITGIMMGTVAFFGVEWVEEVHEAAYGWLMVSVALHVGGVLFDQWRTGVPLVRAMIDGRKAVARDRPVK
ncbi:cytochrome b/b6 domain-containing protein [Ruegeria marina]|uniref:Cytochrome b n=1 Tax=Ruegeria marina TaxID=639004 RepID=A0A1G7BV80_9RHOB|nr:cytochrome b/b6 domain-containing protein [Ruegeria marina]SDE30969.1 Cytochrome b [Ruegeria marina]